MTTSRGEGLGFSCAAEPFEHGASIVDVATGAKRLVPMDTPVAFAPDAASLFGIKGSDYVVIDADEVVTPLLDATHTHVKAVARWEGDVPSAVIVDSSSWLEGTLR